MEIIAHNHTDVDVMCHHLAVAVPARASVNLTDIACQSEIALDSFLMDAVEEGRVTLTFEPTPTAQELREALQDHPETLFKLASELSRHPPAILGPWTPCTRPYVGQARSTAAGMVIAIMYIQHGGWVVAGAHELHRECNPTDIGVSHWKISGFDTIQQAIEQADVLLVEQGYELL